jgi:hypothetical protein
MNQDGEQVYIGGLKEKKYKSTELAGRMKHRRLRERLDGYQESMEKFKKALSGFNSLQENGTSLLVVVKFYRGFRKTVQ